MDNYNEDQAYRGGSAGALTPDAQEAKRLRNQLVEYDGYLQEMRKSNMKNVETLDVIQRYTDKSAAGIQKLTEESAAGMQKLAEECASGLRRYSADGSSSLQEMAENGSAGIAGVARTGEEGLNRLAEDGLQKLSHLAEISLQQLEGVTEESLTQIKALAEESVSRILEVNNRNVETAERVDEIRELVAGQTESLREMQKETDEFTHRENVKVYRNVQAVVVEEVKKQTEELKEANRGLKPMLIITLAVTLANAALFILQILGILGV